MNRETLKEKNLSIRKKKGPGRPPSKRRKVSESSDKKKILVLHKPKPNPSKSIAAAPQDTTVSLPMTPQIAVQKPLVIQKLLNTYGHWSVLGVRVCLTTTGLWYYILATIKNENNSDTLTVSISKQGKIFHLEIMTHAKEMGRCIVQPLPLPHPSLQSFLQKAELLYGAQMFWMEAGNRDWISIIMQANSILDETASKFLQNGDRRCRNEDPIRNTILLDTMLHRTHEYKE